MMGKGQKRLTINDIARLAGVSATTVSFVLNEREGIGSATREKVNSVIQATGFQPNASSRRLSFQKSFNIALIYPSSASPFSDLYYYEITRGLTERLSQEEYNVVFVPLANTENDFTLPRILLHHDADGVIILQDISTVVLSAIDQLEIPYVLVDIHAPDPTHTHVSVDSEISIYTAVTYLIRHGHKKIAFLGSDWLPSYYVQCLTGYQKALGEHNLPIYTSWLQKGANDTTSTQRCMKEILNGFERPTAICCMGDIRAIDAMAVAKACSLAIPDDLSFISIDDIVLSRYVDPPLSTIGYDKLSMGYKAAELLMEKIAGKMVQSVIVASDKIIERRSVKTIG